MALNNVLTEDLNSLLASEIEWSNFKDKRILVTGATGLVGSMVVRTLIYANEKLDLGLEVIGLIRNQAKADKIYEGCMGKDALSFCLDDLSGDEPISLEGKVDYIVHAAAVTTSKVMVSDPVGTIDVALKGTKNILNLAVEKGTKGVVYISSMEIYGQSADPEDTKENDLGYVDLAAVRSCYPEANACVLLTPHNMESESLLHAWPKRLEQVSCRQKIAYLHNLQEARSKEKTSFLRRKASLKETMSIRLMRLKRF